MITYPNVKVNIGLNVLRKRQDGYHDIETLFYPYSDIHDVLEIVEGDDFSRTSQHLFSIYGNAGAPVADRTVSPFSMSAGGTEDSCILNGIAAHDGEPGRIRQDISEDGKLMITIARKEGVDWEPLHDLCAKAYRLLDNDFGLPPVKIFLEKLAPVGAGLGGGSSDAAATLRMLSEMFSLALDENALAGYAARLGSDCAFFVYNRPMFGEGRGEILSDCTFSDISGYDLKVLSPEGISVSTADAYRGIVPGIPAIPLKEALQHPVEEWPELVTNDFEKTVFAAHPQLAAIRQSLYDSGAIYASMSGSGSSLFAIYRR